MDEFMKCGMKHIGVGGLKCPCCTSYRTFGNHKKRSKKYLKTQKSYNEKET